MAVQSEPLCMGCPGCSGHGKKMGCTQSTETLVNGLLSVECSRQKKLNAHLHMYEAMAYSPNSVFVILNETVLALTRKP